MTCLHADKTPQLKKCTFCSTFFTENTPSIRFSWLSNVYSCVTDVCLSDVSIAWSESFTATTPLVYVVSLGSTKGGNDILNWVETTESVMEVKNVIYRPVFVSVTAVNNAGLYETIWLDVPV